MLCGALGSQLMHKPMEATTSCLLQHVQDLASNMTRATLVQIGAHLSLMNSNDPFLRLRGLARRVLVEPQPHIAAKLRAAAGPDTVVMNRAVGSSDSFVEFYSVDERVDPVNGCFGKKCRGYIATQIASLSRDHILKHKKWIPDIEELIVNTTVQVSTVDTILRDADVDGARELLVLAIDAEGYDDKIIASTDWHRVRPWLVVFEHTHFFPHRVPDLNKVQQLLRSHGYACFRDIENHWCIGGSPVAGRSSAFCENCITTIYHRCVPVSS